MPTQPLATITQQLRQSPNTIEAAQQLLAWIAAQYGMAYLAYGDHLLVADDDARNPQVMRWLKDRSQWRNIDAPQLTAEALFVPVIYNGRTQGMLVIEGASEEANYAIPLIEMLAGRLDRDHTAMMVSKARQLAEAINHTRSLDAMLAQTVKGLMPLFSAVSAVIFRFEPGDARGESLAEHPTRSTIGRDMGATDYEKFSQLFADQPIVILDDVTESEGSRMVRLAMRTMGAKQVVLAPMYATGHVVGALALALSEATQERQFSGREQQLLQMLSQVVSNAGRHLRRVNHQKQSDLLDYAMFRQLIDKANVAIDIHAPDGTVIYRNQAWNDLFLRDPREEQQFIDRLPDAEKAMAEELIYPNATRNRGWTNFITLRKRDLSEFDAHVSVVALRDNDETVIGYSTITDDVTELHHVMDALQAQTTRLAAAASVSQAIITTSDLAELSEGVLRLICTQFKYDQAQIWTINEARNELKCINACNYQGDVVENLQGEILSLNRDSAAKWVIANGRMLMLNDAQNDERHWQHASLPLMGSELVLLLQAAQEVLGVIVVQSRYKDSFGLDDADVMQSIADQVAIAIYNTSLFSQLTDRLADMSAIKEVSLLVQAAFDLDGLMRRIYDAMQRVHDTGDFTFAMPSDVPGMMTLITYRDGKQKRSTKRMGQDLISQILAQAATIYWRSPDERAATASYFGIEADDLPQSFLGLPVIAKDRVLGVLFTEADSYTAFDENDLQFMLNLVNSAAFAIENMQLLDDTKRRVREMEIINSISHTLSETFGMSVMWDQLAGDLENLFPHGVVAITLYDSTTKMLKAPVIGNNQVMLQSPPQALARSIVEHGISLVFQDLSQADERLESMGVDPFSLILGELRSWVGTPLKSRNNDTIGVIALQSNETNAFTDRDLSLLNMVAAQTSLAMDNAFLLIAEQERREIANSLIDMGRIVTSTLNVDDVFARILEQIERLLNYERAAILIPSEDAPHMMTIYTVEGFDEEYIQQTITIDADSAIWQVWQSQEPVTIPNVKQSDDWETQPAMLLEGQTRSWMGVPLVVQGQVSGIISLDTNDDIPYAVDDATPIFALAQQASIAVENAQLHTELEDNVISLKNRAERLATMHHLANYVSSSLSQSAILDHTSNLLTDLFKASYACIIRIDEMDGNGYLVAEHPDTHTLGQAVIVKGTAGFEAFQNIVTNNTAMRFNSEKALATIVTPEINFQEGVIAPLIAHERVLGCIVLILGADAHDFDSENLETFMTIAAQIAVAIRNAELFQDALDASRLKSEFLANVSHELRTPLNAIIGYSELLLSGTYGTLDDRQEDRLERVFRSGRQLLSLINDILDLSKIEAGRMDLELMELDISSLVTDAISTIQPQVEYKQLELVKMIEDDLPAVYVDPQRMRQVLTNLLSNAVKFTQEGDIHVEVRRTTVNLHDFPNLPQHMAVQGNIWLHISVSDTGIGISDKDQQLIFDAFTQVDGSSIREYEGTGLGLAITQQLVSLHKGHIWLESELDVGSTFHILLPSLETIQAPKYSIDPNDDRPVVVLLDEDEMTLQLMSEYLDPQIYHVMTTREPHDIYNIAESARPSIIIVDLMMPHTEGIKQLEQFATHDQLAGVPIVVCSILDRERDVLEHGAAAFIKKPVTRRDILDAINDLT